MTEHAGARPLVTVRPIEVRIYEYGLLKATERCSTPGEAQRVADDWSRDRGVHCQIIVPPAIPHPSHPAC